MRYLVISDIHGNWEALRAVLEAAAAEGVDDVLVLGDLVGYGAQPNEVVEEVSKITVRRHIVRGNHDKVVAGLEDGSGFNEIAMAAAEWTARTLTAENLEYVRKLPSGPSTVAAGVVICHGSPLDEDEYIMDLGDAGQVFLLHDAQVTFFGHTHIPSLFIAEEGRVSGQVLEGDSLTLQVSPARRYLVNPGSVGQPRDRDPRAAYCIYDTRENKLTWRRREYQLAAAQQKILAEDLPEVLAYRLAAGL
jgi:predicted phosphodiesterase